MDFRRCQLNCSYWYGLTPHMQLCPVSSEGYRREEVQDQRGITHVPWQSFVHMSWSLQYSIGAHGRSSQMQQPPSGITAGGLLFAFMYSNLSTTTAHTITITRKTGISRQINGVLRVSKKSAGCWYPPYPPYP